MIEIKIDLEELTVGYSVGIEEGTVVGPGVGIQVGFIVGKEVGSCVGRSRY
jgi:hypothetical protein